MKMLDFESLVSEIRKINQSGKRALITFHSVGDSDSVASAFALSSYIKNSKVVTPDTITWNSKRILKELGFKEKIPNVFDRSADVIVLLDVNNFDGCGAFEDELKNFDGDILIIDHHLLNQQTNQSEIFNDENYSSTSGIVFEVLRSLNHTVDKKTAKLLAIGIISDSAEFKNSNYETFIQLGELLKLGSTDYVSLLDEIRRVSPAKDRMKTVKRLFGSDVVVKSDLLFVSGGSDTHANILADMAINCGADIALFYSVSKDEISFSARMRPPLDRELDIHLGKVMNQLSTIINGSGGGHPCAAGAYGKNRTETAKQRFIDGFEKIIFG
jgi:nanoRNase/pAp phosphatase (c-di-AMP/oligoRNAs hydrolase)